MERFFIRSPQGTRIAFTPDRDSRVESYVMNADGSGQARLTDNPAGMTGNLPGCPVNADHGAREG